MEFEEIKARLSKLDTASLADANKGLRVFDPAIRPVRTGLRLVGRARTVRCEGDFLTVIKALYDSVSGDVLVIDTQGTRAAVAGELFSTEAARRGLAGIVVDGAVRDTAKIQTLDFPVYARSVIPLSGTSAKISETQVPIQCGGVSVNPQDVVFGDDDGLIVATVSELIELIPIAEEIQRKEEAVLARMECGDSLFDMLNFHEHYENVKSGRASKLKFLL